MSYLISSLQDRLFPAITHYQIVIVLREAISVKLACLHVHTPRVVRIQHIVNPPSHITPIIIITTCTYM